MATAYNPEGKYTLEFMRCPRCKKLLCQTDDKPTVVMPRKELYSLYPEVGCMEKSIAEETKGDDFLRLSWFYCLRCGIGVCSCAKLPSIVREEYERSQTMRRDGDTNGIT